MVDIHSHILPGLDDGSTTLQETVEMLKIAAGSGTTDIVATPHASSEYNYDLEKVEAAFHEVSAISKGIINVHLGCDFHLTAENLYDALNFPQKYTINHHSYLMVELPNMVSLPIMRGALQKLLDARIYPVITHPERNPSILGNPRELHNWVKDGCLLQITGQSLLGRFGGAAQKYSESLMSSDLVHFVASDAHDPSDRSPDLSGAFRWVSMKFGQRYAERLFIENPAATLLGEPLNTTSAVKPRKTGLFSFLK